MKRIRLTTAEALARYLAAQKIVIDGQCQTLFGCCFAIFGHGNVTCFGEQLKRIEEIIPTWRGQNEQSMALAAVAYGKANKRQRIGIATSSIGPGSANMVTAAGVAHSNRLPLLMISGDTFATRLPDPVLQQVEHFHNPTITTSDAFKAVTRYWDRIQHPEQLLQSLPQAINVLLDPVSCGPAFLGVAQDIWGYTFDFPECFFAERVHRIRRPEPEQELLEEAAATLLKAERPLLISGGGVHYADAHKILDAFARNHQIPVVETIAGRASLLQDHPLNCGPLGITGSNSANHMAAKADAIIAVGTRLQDFTTGSWTVFRQPDLKIITINVSSFDACKHQALAIIADARKALEKLDQQLGAHHFSDGWAQFGQAETKGWQQEVVERTRITTSDKTISYAQVVGAVNRLLEPGDTVLTAAGGLPGELAMNWQSRQLGCFDIEYGYSCMGYEIAGGWGVKIARPDNDVVVLVGDGSYMMLNSDIYSSVLSRHKLIIIVCDNAGFAVIKRLQINTGNRPFNNQLEDCRRSAEFSDNRTDVSDNSTKTSDNGSLPRVDFAKHAEAQGALAIKVEKMAAFDKAFVQAKAADRTTVIVVETDPDIWSGCDCWWEVGLPQTCDDKEVASVVAEWEAGRKYQRPGV